jgi:hypothetical protein
MMNALEEKHGKCGPESMPSRFDSHAVAQVSNALALCDEHGDVATASLVENWIDEAERRVWFLYEATRPER